VSCNSDGAAEVAAIALPLQSAKPKRQKAVHIPSSGHGSPSRPTPPVTEMPPTISCTASVSWPSRCFPWPAAPGSTGGLDVGLAAVPTLTVIIGVVAPT